MSPKGSPTGLALSVIGVVGAALLIVSLFLDWYSLGEITLGGWSALEFGDVLFVLILTESVRGAFSERRALMFLGFGVAALAFVAIAAATNVPTIEASTAADSELGTSLEAGVFVAGAGALLLLVAGGLGVAIEAETPSSEGTATPPPSPPSG